MNKVIWRNKGLNYINVISGKCDVYFMWKWMFNLKHRQWHSFVHIPFIRFHKNNCSVSFGLCFGKYFIDIAYHW